MGAPTVLIQDNIQASPLGGGQPAGIGWSGSGTIEPYSGSPDGTGQYPGQQWFFFRPGQLIQSPILSGTPPVQVSFFMGWNFTNNIIGSFTQLTFFILNPISLTQEPCFYLIGNPDGSLSAIDSGGTMICNSGKDTESYFNHGEWYFGQINVQFTAGGSGQITIAVSAAVQGVEIMNNSLLTSANISGGFGMNQFAISAGATGGMAICNITLAEFVDLALTNPSNYPSQPSVGPPNTTPNANFQQLVIELVKLPATTNTQVQQLAAELAKIPNNTNVVTQQLVIEIAYTGVLLNILFPEYVRRRHVGS